MNPPVKVNGISSLDYLRLMSPIKHVTDDNGLIVQKSDKSGELQAQRIGKIKFIFTAIGHFFRRLSRMLTCRGWINDKKIAHRLREGLAGIDLRTHEMVIRRLYHELTHRLSGNEDLGAIKDALDSLKKDPEEMRQPKKLPIISPSPRLTKPVDRTQDQLTTLQPTIQTFPVVGELKNKLDERTGFKKKAPPPFVPPNIPEEENNVAAYKKLADQVSRPSTSDLEKAQILKKYEKLNVLLQSNKTQLNDCTDQRDSVVKSLKEELFLKKDSLQNSDNVPTLYKKEELIERIRFLYIIEQENRLKLLLDELLILLKKVPHDYIYEHSIEMFTEKLEKLTRGLNQYYSTYDTKEKNFSQTLEKEDLDRYRERSGLVIKRAVENERELLAGKLFKILGLGKFFVTKEQISLPAQMVNNKMHGESKGIIGRWVVGEKFFDREWNVLMTAQRNFAAAAFKDKDNIPENIQTALKDAEQKVRGLGCYHSIQELALADLLLLGADSHTDQYKLSQGELYNYDFARFLTPSLVFKVGDEIYTTLKSTLLDHPFSKDPIGDELLKKIKSLDLDVVKNQFTPYVGNSKDYENAVKELNDLSNDKLAYSRGQNVIKICKTHGVSIKKISTRDVLKYLDHEIAKINKKIKKEANPTYKTKLAELELDKAVLQSNKKQKHSLCKKYKISPKLPSVKEIDELLSAKEVETRKNCYSKINPKAYEGFVYRLEKLQAYVNEQEKPTLAGAFAAIYPDFNLFLQAYQRYETNPFLAIGSGFFRSFNSIIQKLEEENLATVEEVEQLKLAHRRLNETACEYEEISTTFNI